MAFAWRGILLVISICLGVSNLHQHQKHPGNFRKSQIHEPYPGLLNQYVSKSFLNDTDDQSQVWEPKIIPHSHFSDEVSNLSKLKGQFIQQIFILQLLSSRHSDFIAENPGLEVPVKHFFLVSQSLAKHTTYYVISDITFLSVTSLLIIITFC